MLDTILIALVGWLCGVLLNYLADILPRYRRLIRPVCLNCEAQFGWRNYFIYPRRCEHCSQSRTWRVYLVELLYIIAALWLWYQAELLIGYVSGMFLLTYLGLVVVIDFEHRLILHPVSLVGAIFGLIFGWMQRGVWSTLAGGAVGFLAMFILFMFGILFANFLSRRRGEGSASEGAMGFGDVIFAGVLGLILGYPAIIACVILAILFAGVISFIYLFILIVLRRYRPNLYIAYGPYLALAAFVLLFLSNWLKALFG